MPSTRWIRFISVITWAVVVACVVTAAFCLATRKFVWGILLSINVGLALLSLLYSHCWCIAKNRDTFRCETGKFFLHILNFFSMLAYTGNMYYAGYRVYDNDYFSKDSEKSTQLFMAALCASSSFVLCIVNAYSSCVLYKYGCCLGYGNGIAPNDYQRLPILPRENTGPEVVPQPPSYDVHDRQELQHQREHQRFHQQPLQQQQQQQQQLYQQQTF
ncbi:uncharacterized protein LOC127855524 [Dreissena polymorpha]|uniref:Uncharacterized protein n=1 Tax=Dreissena polymorpha TaxID=45954 RepID=A0A9D4C332_DREPO|nr:uncharacterized protein LOC127855524 [Dreissena polymorpha]XP_052247149.1 uncharacterized protein LOC127855524 [Dreissena polymorpha]KAH3716266.1 hypothetical protein DPMN_058985 [Dreissena polymorpha]